MLDIIYVHFTYIIRIIIACICGLCIGYERKSRAKEAGVRTHCVVACGAALIMIVSKYGFYDMVPINELFKLDPSRIAASIVSGIGFLGAGMIFVHHNTVSGLTTAAGVWVTAGIGMAVGAGMYWEGIITTVIVLNIQIFLHGNSRFVKSVKLKKLIISDVAENDFLDKATEILEKHDIVIHEVDIRKSVTAGTSEYELTIEMPSHISEESIVNSLDYSCEITVNR